MILLCITITMLLPSFFLQCLQRCSERHYYNSADCAESSSSSSKQNLKFISRPNFAHSQLLILIKHVHVVKMELFLLLDSVQQFIGFLIK